MALKIVAGIGLLLAVLSVVIATRPSAFRVARSVTINARPDYAFSLVNDFDAMKTAAEKASKEGASVASAVN